MDPITIGGALGAVARFAPAVLDFYDRKAKRKHDLELLDKTQSGASNLAAIEAFKSAIQTQGQVTGVKWVDAINTLIRPLITIQWVIVLYPTALALQWYQIFDLSGGNLAAATAATAAVFGVGERALCSAIVNFWFVDRVLVKARAA